VERPEFQTIVWLNRRCAAVLGYAVMMGAAGSRAAPRSDDDLAQAITRIDSRDAQERADAAAGLRAVPDARAAVPALIKLLGDATPTRAAPEDALAPRGRIFPSPGFEAAKTLARMGGEVLDPLVTAARSPDVATRERAVWALLNWRDPRGTAVERAVADADPDVRALAAGGLVGGLGVNPLGTLLDAANDRDANVRQAAVWSLGNISHSPRAADAIIRSMKDDPEPDVRAAAATALGNSGDPRAHDLLVAALGATDPAIRSTAIQMLGNMHDARAVPALIGLLADKDPRVRADAVASLGGIKDEHAAAPLMGLIADEDPRVRMGAMDALGKITGRPASTDAARWQAWWAENKSRYPLGPSDGK
jgi:HEAT repeat protein